MAEIGSLGELRPIEELDLSNYQDQKASFQLPKAGIYDLQARPEFPIEAFKRSNSGAITAEIDPVIVGPTNVGFKIRFIRPSAKSYLRNKTSVSQMGDYLRAHGVKQKLTTEAELIDAVSATAGRVFKAFLDWSAYYKPTEFKLEGMEKFTSDGNGGYLPYTTVPGEYEKDEATGEDARDAEGNKIPLRVRANIFIRRYVAQEG